MNDLKEEYLNLITQTKKFLLQELESEDLSQEKRNWITTDKDTYHYFRNYAKKRSSPSVQNQVIAKNSEPEPMTITKTPIKPVPVTTHKNLNLEVKPKETTKIQEVQEKNVLEKKEEISYLEQVFELKPLGHIEPKDLSDVKHLVQKILPKFTIINHTPSSEPLIVIVADLKNKLQDSFLNNYVTAINLCIAKAKWIPSNKVSLLKQFKELKLIIQIDPIENDFLNPCSKIIIPNFHDYLKNPKAKSELWKLTKNAFIS